MKRTRRRRTARRKPSTASTASWETKVGSLPGDATAEPRVPTRPRAGRCCASAAQGWRLQRERLQREDSQPPGVGAGGGAAGSPLEALPRAPPRRARGQGRARSRGADGPRLPGEPAAGWCTARRRVREPRAQGLAEPSGACVLRRWRFGGWSRRGSIIYRKLGQGRGGGGARKEEPARGSLNEFVNQTRTRSLNGPLKPCLTVD